MLSIVIRTSFALIILSLLSPSLALRGFGSRGYNAGKYSGYSGGKYNGYSGGEYNGYNRGEYSGYNDPLEPKTYVGTSSGIPLENTPRRGLGISAWGIVTVIVVLILAGMGYYYFSMCYPVLCKKERSYIMKVDNA